MSDQIEEVVENLKQTSAWQRVFFVIGFGLLFNIVLVPLTLLTLLVQIVFSLFAGAKNDNIAALSAKFIAYMHEVLAFVLFVAEHKPFPFNDFPEMASEEADSAVTPDRGYDQPAAPESGDDPKD
jgi:hypothetical protein